MSDSFELRFLESHENVQESLRHALGRTSNAVVARGIATYVQQARMFYASANQVPLEIRPLLLFYGTMALSRAIIAGRRLRAPDTLKGSHGLRDVTQAGSRIADLALHVAESGTFFDFNGVVSELEGIQYIHEASTVWHRTPTASSCELVDQTITLREILARVPTLESQYQKTFQEPPLTMPFVLLPTLFSAAMQPKSDGPILLRVVVEPAFTDSDGLQQLITVLCSRYPMLARFRFLQAKSEGNKSILEFQNAIPMDDCVVEVVAIGQGRCRPLEHKGFVDSRGLLDPICSGLAFDVPTLSVPLRGRFISAASLLYLGIFLLGSVVRYQPQIWVHAVTRLATPERTADDQTLALIEAFLDTVQKQFPALAVRLLTMSL